MASAGQLTAKIVLGGLDAVDRQLQGFSNAMGKVAKDVSKMGSHLQSAGESMSRVGENIAPLSAGLVALGGASVLASDNINSAMNNFKTKMGASGKDLAKLQGVMEEVGSTGVGNFDEVSNAVVSLNQNMKGLSPKEMTTLTEEAMQLSNVMGEDVTEVSKVAGQIMKQFGVDGSTALDLIAKGYQNGMDYAGDYSDTLNEYSVYFKNLGFDAEDMFNVLAEGAEAGAFNLDKVGDAVKEFGIRSKDGSDASREAFEALGLDADKMTQTFAKGGEGAKKGYAEVVNALSGVKDQTERNAIGVALFGTQYEDMEKDVIASTGNITDHMKGFEGTAGEVAKNNQTFAQQMQGWWNDIQVAIKPVGDILRQFVSDVMPSLISGIKSMSTAFAGMSPVMQKVVIGFGAFVAFLAPMLIGIGSFLSVMGTMVTGIGGIVKGFGLLATAGSKLITAIKMIGTAFRALSAIFMANPFMLIIAGIVIVAVLIYKYWDEIVATTKAVWSALSAWFAPYWSAFVDMVMVVVDGCISAWNSFSTAFMSVMTAIGDFFVTIWNGLKTVFMAVWDFYVAYITTVFGIITTIVQGAWEVIKTIFLIAIGLILMIVAPLWNAFATGCDFIVQVITIAFNKIKSWVSSSISFLSDLWHKYVAVVKAIWSAIYSAIIAPIVNKIKAIVTTLIAKAKQVMSTVKSAFSTAWNAIYGSVISPVISRIKAIINTLIGIAKSVMSAVKSAFTTAWNAVKSVVTSVVNGIKSVINTIIGKVQTVVSNVKNKFTSTFDSIRDKVSTAIGKIIDKITGIWDKAKEVASNIKDAFSNLFGGIKVPSFSMSNASLNPKDWIKNGLPKLKVAWHAKGGILDSTTLIGAGEKGAESIVPLSSQRRMAPFAQAVARFMPEDKNTGGNTEINIAQLVVREEADVAKIAQELNRLQARKERAKGGLNFA